MGLAQTPVLEVESVSSRRPLLSIIISSDRRLDAGRTDEHNLVWMNVTSSGYNLSN